MAWGNFACFPVTTNSEFYCTPMFKTAHSNHSFNVSYSYIYGQLYGVSNLKQLMIYMEVLSFTLSYGQLDLHLVEMLQTATDQSPRSEFRLRWNISVCGEEREKEIGSLQVI